MRQTDRSGALLKNKSFLGLWLGQLVSNLGDKLLHINAIGFAVAAHHAAGSAMAQVLIWATAPSLLLGFVAGVVVDRANRKHVMIASDLFRAVLLASLPFAAGYGFWAVCLVIALVASASCFFGPARTALIPSAVSSQQLVAANAWFAASGFVVALIGTAIGSWLLVWLGLKTSLWINAGVFGLSALAISLASIKATAPDADRSRAWTDAINEFKAGLRLIGRHRVVRAMILHYVVLMGFATASYVGLVGFSGHGAELGLRGASLLLSAVVVGLLAGGLSVHALSCRIPVNRVVSIGLSLIAVGGLGIATNASVVALMSWLVALGAGGAIYASVIEATLQQVVPDSLRGRILASRGVVSGIVVLGTSALSGWLIDHQGKGVLFGAIAAVALIGALRVLCNGQDFVYRSIRRIFRMLAFAYFRMDIKGLEQIPQRGGAIIAGNHPNVLDGLFLLAVLPRPVRFLVAEEMYEHRYLHWLFKVLGCIPVYRTKTHNGDALRAAVTALQRGEILGIFPEGTTHFHGSMQQAKRGVALLALKTGLPVIPLAIHGSFEAYPPGTKVPSPRTIRMRFDVPLSYRKIDFNPIPERCVAETLEGIRLHILQTMDDVEVEPAQWKVPQWLKELQVAVASLIVLPLASFLMLTANPSLDPAEKGRRG